MHAHVLCILLEPSKYYWWMFFIDFTEIILFDYQNHYYIYLSVFIICLECIPWFLYGFIYRISFSFGQKISPILKFVEFVQFFIILCNMLRLPKFNCSERSQIYKLFNISVIFIPYYSNWRYWRRKRYRLVHWSIFDIAWWLYSPYGAWLRRNLSRIPHFWNNPPSNNENLQITSLRFHFLNHHVLGFMGMMSNNIRIYGTVLLLITFFIVALGVKFVQFFAPVFLISLSIYLSKFRK